MIRRIVFFATLFVVLAACGIARADYVTVTQGGYGPFACAGFGGGPLPSWGYAELYAGSWYLYGCQRYRGDIQTATHVGRSFSLPADPYFSLKMSPQLSTVYACSSIVPGNSPVPCDAYKTETSDDPYTDDWRNGAVIGYVPPCPSTPGMNQIYVCSGSYTPYDGSGIPTAIITDSHVSPGLPHGNPLKLQPSVGTDVSCLATMSNYPAVPNLGHAQWMAVYTCP